MKTVISSKDRLRLMRLFLILIIKDKVTKKDKSLKINMEISLQKEDKSSKIKIVILL